jgi:hypothetical protein
METHLARLKRLDITFDRVRPRVRELCSEEGKIYFIKLANSSRLPQWRSSGSKMVRFLGVMMTG